MKKIGIVAFLLPAHLPLGDIGPASPWQKNNIIVNNRS